MTEQQSARPLRRFPQDEVSFISGVCAGIAYWLGAPAWIVRLAVFLVILFVSAGIGIFIYLALWSFLPEWEEIPDDYKKISGG